MKGTKDFYNSPIKNILPVTVNPGDEALASEYETTRDSWTLMTRQFFEKVMAATFLIIFVIQVLTCTSCTISFAATSM